MPAVMLGTAGRIISQLEDTKKEELKGKSETSNTAESKRVLVLFSGGKDSFLTACKYLDAGYSVGLLSFNNGALAAEKHLLHGATRLSNRYGADRVQYEGVYNTAATISRLKEWYANQSYMVLRTEFSNLVPTQVMCLHCQVAMWIAAIAYADARHFDAIATGYHKSDEFCTGSTKFIRAMSALAGVRRIHVDTPLWEEADDGVPWEVWRDLQMTSRGFEPSVLEPKCMLGMPCSKLTPDQEREMVCYYERHLIKIAESQITHLSSVFKHLRLSSESLAVGDYKVPNPDTWGYY